MESSLFATLVQVESNSLAREHTLPAAPQRVLSRTYPAVPQQDPIELTSLRYSRNDNNSSNATTPREEIDLEMTAPGTPAESSEPVDAVDALPGLNDPPMNKFRLTSCCLQNVMAGLTDSAPGALIPYMEADYDIGYAVVSLIFIGNAMGFIMAAPFVDQIRQRLGRAKTIALSQICMGVGYIPFICTAPFPLVAISYFLLGFGCAIQLAIGNVFCANLRNNTTMLGLMHGSYGVGGIVGPLVATAIVSSGAVWSRYYLLTLGFAIFNTCFSTWSFWNYEKELGGVESNILTETSSRGDMSMMLLAFKSKVVILGAIFIFAYQGAEVSISGWVISFLISARNGEPSSVGYVTSGFWAGITIGRFCLSPISSRIGEKLFVYFLVIGAAVFQLLVWLVPNIVGEAVSLSIVGLLLGPVYPCAAAIFTRNLSRREQVSGMGIISAFGSSGGAMAPFTTGLLAQAVGTFVMHPVAIGLFTAMLVCWFVLPDARKRTE
ncbi:MFS general substrate transporter [Annulohypoxylon truncatum]|uniref:MFS general substrate transporter n=1 Tax=Annulohypoxylon truncatum TaxID=327061 RepID=UPI0020082D94|nr:MFS general substrate transporter [Annulohypoxylon truncatum]KAI1208329.1 MFS general substrate transporter [Annulohypoxylon truncatum]